MKLRILSLSEKIKAGERVLSLAFGHYEKRPALKAALPENATVIFRTDEIKISLPRRRPLFLFRERRRWGRWGAQRWRLGKRTGERLIYGLAKLLRLPVPMTADRLLDAAGWRQ